MTASRGISRITILALAACLSVAGCSSLSTVRLQPENVDVGPGLRPVAAMQASAISAYFLFLPIPGGADLDRVVNRMLVVAAKTMGADKITDLEFETTPESGIWALRKVLGWRSARATAVAVQLTGPADDPHADRGPEDDSAPAPTPAPATPPDGP